MAAIGDGKITIKKADGSEVGSFTVNKRVTLILPYLLMLFRHRLAMAS